MVFKRLRRQFTESGAGRGGLKIRLALACGKIRNDRDRAAIHAMFNAKGWELWDEQWIREGLERMAKQRYENQISSVVAKLIFRNKGK